MANAYKRFAPFLMVFLFYFAARISFFYIPVYLNYTGLTGLEIGVLVSLSSFAALIGFFPSGVLNDRKSVKRPLLISFFLLSSFYFGLTVLDGFAQLFALFLFGGVGLKVGSNCLRNLFLKSRADKKGEKLGRYQLLSNLGVGLGVASFSLLVTLFHFNIVFCAIAVFFLLLGFLLFFMDDLETSPTKIHEYKADFMRKEVVFFSAILFLFTMHWGAESTSYGLLLTEDLGLSLAKAGHYMSFSLVFMGFSAYFFGKRLDKKSVKVPDLMFFGMFFSGLTHVLMVNENVWLSFLARVIHETADGAFHIAMLFWITGSFDFRRVAGNASILMTVTVLGEVAGSIVFSTIGDIYGYSMAFILSGFLGIASATVFLAYKNRFFR